MQQGRTILQPNEGRIREDLTFDNGPVFRVRALRKAPVSVTRVTYDMTGPAVELHAGGGENALVTGMHLIDVSACELWIDGRHIMVPPMKRFDTTLLDLNSKHIVCVPPSDVMLFHMPREAFDAIADEQGVRRIEPFRGQPTRPLVDPVLRSLAPLLQAALERPEQANCLFTDHIAIALLAHVARTHCGMGTAQRVQRGGLAPWQERRAKELLIAQLNGEVTLEALAQECGLSRSHFARAFKTTTGLPPHRWLLDRRIERARELLLNSALPIADVADLCGFADQSHFTRVFTNALGVSPGKWRRLRRT
ncbi:MAG: AraC family transcriptional regulator [Acetobacteraceae bacterium]|nr:AraC family transcriptional regulator [Acetobacteraceae bacterium]MEA2770813.1 AraC family transcriptional regulator [Acetobacteraceae bacterium]